MVSTRTNGELDQKIYLDLLGKGQSWRQEFTLLHSQAFLRDFVDGIMSTVANRFASDFNSLCF